MCRYQLHRCKLSKSKTIVASIGPNGLCKQNHTHGLVLKWWEGGFRRWKRGYKMFSQFLLFNPLPNTEWNRHIQFRWDLGLCKKIHKNWPSGSGDSLRTNCDTCEANWGAVLRVVVLVTVQWCRHFFCRGINSPPYFGCFNICGWGSLVEVEESQNNMSATWNSQIWLGLIQFPFSGCALLVIGHFEVLPTFGQVTQSPRHETWIWVDQPRSAFSTPLHLIFTISKSSSVFAMSCQSQHRMCRQFERWRSV